jgi:hypothetical protein
MVHTQFFEKKYRSLFDGTSSEFEGQNYPYILFFQVNHVNSKEWISLKNTFHELTPSTLHHMIPKRFLVHILQPDIFPEKTHSLFSFMEYQDKFLPNQGPLQGHTCFFFCQTLDEVQKFFQNSDDVQPQKGPFGLSFQEPLVLSKTLWTPSQQRRFIPLGLFERIHAQHFALLFWNSYDVQKILHLHSQKISPHQQLITQVFYPTMTLPLHMFYQWYSSDLIRGSHPFQYHHYELCTLLNMFSSKLKANSETEE